MAYYAGLSFTGEDAIPEDSDRLTIFLKDFNERGDDNLTKRNYMYALTTDKMPFYADKINSFFNDVYARISAGHEPVISTFKDELVRFFMTIHIGPDDYPDYVLRYFSLFIEVIGFISNPKVDITDWLIEGRCLEPKVRKYLNKRDQVVIENQYKTTFVHWWNLIGLSLDGLATEFLHNIVAFTQFINTFYLLVTDKIWYEFLNNGGPPIPIPCWLPNSPIPPPSALPGSVGPVNFFQYLPNQYGDFIATSYPSMYNGPFPTPPDQLVIGDLNVEDYTNFSEYDNIQFNNVTPFSVYNDGTVIDKNNQSFTPVFNNNSTRYPGALAKPYYPFGQGYRACPGIIFNMFLTEKMITKFAALEFEFVDPSTIPNSCPSRCGPCQDQDSEDCKTTCGPCCDPDNIDRCCYVSLAPRRPVFDNLFVKSQRFNGNNNDEDS